MKESKRIPLSINGNATILDRVNTNEFFDKSAGALMQNSPIDLFGKNIEGINDLLGMTAKHAFLGQIMLLGYVSAVESYFRQVFRSIINCDVGARKSCMQKSLDYGAAYSYAIKSPDLLPEALLEKYTFIKKDVIVNVIDDFLGIKINLPDELTTSLNEFERICHLRHCAVHRFGRLGSMNAIFLGLEEHGDKIDLPIKLESKDLVQIAAICSNLVKIANNTLFDLLLFRSVNNKTIDWQWDLRKDRKHFKMYFDLFYSNKFSSKDEHDLKKLYDIFRNNHER